MPRLIWRTLRKSVRKWLEKTTLPRFLFAMLLATDMIYHDIILLSWSGFFCQLLEMLNDTTFMLLRWMTRSMPHLCLMLEHDKGLVLKSLQSTWDLRSRSWQGMVSHFWIAVAMQGCWTLGNTPNDFDITEYESTLEAKLLCCTPWYSISCDASCGTWRVAAGVSSFFWHLTWTGGARDE